MTAALSPLADALFLPDAQLAASRLDLSRVTLPPRLRPGAQLSVLDITEWYGETAGGIRTYLREKAAYVEARPRLAQTLVLSGPRDALSQSEGVRCYRLRGPRMWRGESYRFLLAFRTCRRIVAHEQPGVIEVGGPGVVPWLARFAARGRDIPVVGFYHSNFPRIFSPWPERAAAWRRALHALAWRYARHIDRFFAHTIVCSEFVANDLRRAGIDRVTRIPLGVDLALFHPRLRAKRPEVRARYGLPEGPVAAYVGRLSGEKEVGLLVDAWPRVYRETGAPIALVGDGPMRRALVAQGDGAPWLRVLPYERDRARLAELLAALDLFVAPSANETFGLAPLEALATGTPVLAADRGGVSEQVESSGAGARFQSARAASLAEEAVRLLRSDLGALGAKGRAYAERDHSWDSIFDRIFALYETVVRR